MNYLKIYKLLVRRAFHSQRYKNDSNYYEGHHVKPNSLGGKRIVLLTAREHYIAHFLLYKYYKKYGNKNEKIKMARAWKAMTFSSKDNIKRYNSHSFEYARKAFNESMKGNNHPLIDKWKDKKWLEMWSKKVSNGLKNMTPEAKAMRSQKQREAKLGTKWSEYHRTAALEARKKEIKNRKPKFLFINKNNEILYSPTYTYILEKYNLSLSMLKRSKSGEKIKRTSEQNKILSAKVKNTIGCYLIRL